MKTVQAVVIGGGVIGTSILYYLAKAGKKVALVEKDGLASGASGATVGCVTIPFTNSKIPLNMCLESISMFPGLAYELESDIQYRKTGAMVIIRNKRQWQLMQEVVKYQQKAGVKAEVLTKKKCFDLEEYLPKDILGAVRYPSNGMVNPINLTLGFARAAQRKYGAEIYTHTKAIDIHLARSGRVDLIITSSGNIRTNIVINAAGVEAPSVGRMVGLEIPIIPCKGELLVTEAVPPLMKHIIFDATILTLPEKTALNLDSGRAMVRQTASGNLLFGWTRDFVGYNKKTTYENIVKTAQSVLKISSQFRYPCLGEVRVIRTWAGFRPCTPDGKPIICLTDKPRGYVVAAGHDSRGIMLSPITGKTVSELLTTQRAPDILAGFGLGRFNYESR